MEEIIVQMEYLVKTGEISDREPVQREDLVHQAWDVEKVETVSLEVAAELGTVHVFPETAGNCLQAFARWLNAPN